MSYFLRRETDHKTYYSPIHDEKSMITLFITKFRFFPVRIYTLFRCIGHTSNVEDTKQLAFSISSEDTISLGFPIWMAVVLILSTLPHYNSFLKNPEDTLIGIFCSFFASSIIKNKREHS